MHLVQGKKGSVISQSLDCPACLSDQLTVHSSFAKGYWLTCESCGLDDWVSTLDSDR